MYENLTEVFIVKRIFKFQHQTLCLMVWVEISIKIFIHMHSVSTF